MPHPDVDDLEAIGHMAIAERDVGAHLDQRHEQRHA
jgi:hypothetical protein